MGVKVGAFASFQSIGLYGPYAYIHVAYMLVYMCACAHLHEACMPWHIPG